MHVRHKPLLLLQTKHPESHLASHMSPQNPILQPFVQCPFSESQDSFRQLFEQRLEQFIPKYPSAHPEEHSDSELHNLSLHRLLQWQQELL